MDVAQVERALRAGGGVLTRRAGIPPGTLDWLVRSGQLVPVLPGVYTADGLSTDPLIRSRAVAAAHPDAVLVGGMAARLGYWPEATVGLVEAAVPIGLRPQPGIRWQRRRIPPEHIRESAGLRFSDPALTAVELAPAENGASIDVVLRKRAASLDQLHAALAVMRGRPGQRARARLVLDSRDEPWSGAERRGHQLLRAAGITGWQANLPVYLDGRQYYLDIAFPRLKLALEIDGRLHEDDPDLFESDRWRQNALVRHGWVVLRFTWAMLRDHPDLVLAEIRAALKMQTAMHL